MDKITWTDCVRNELLYRVNWDRNILHRVKRRKANWIGHILCRNCLLQHIIEGKTERGIKVMGTRRRRRRRRRIRRRSRRRRRRRRRGRGGRRERR